MAEKSGRNKSIEELTAEIGQSRERVAHDLRGLKYELDFPAKFRRSFRQQTVSWLSAAAAVGALIALAPMRKKKIYVNAKSRPQISEEARRKRRCSGRAKNRGKSRSSGDCRVRQNPAHGFWRSIEPQKISPMWLMSRVGASLLRFTHSAKLRNYFRSSHDRNEFPSRYPS